VPRRVEPYVTRQVLPDLLDLALDGRGDVEGVRLRLPDDAEADRGLSLVADDLALVLCTDRDPPHVVQPGRPAGRLGNHQLAEALGRRQLAERLDGELAPRAFAAPRRDLDVAATKRRIDVSDRQALRGQPVVVDPHAHRIALLAADDDLGDARQLR